jgi:phosphoadenosine phosphosulfate reductase
MYLVKDLDVEWRHARRIERRFGVRIIGVPHWDLARLLKNCIYRPYVVGSERIKLLRQSDVEAFVRRETGADWCAWGNRAADSVVRNAYLKRIRGVDAPAQRFYPIWRWKKPDVYGYLHGRKLPVPAMTGGAVKMGGVSLDPKCLRWLRDNEPKDFRRILEVFPFAEAAVIKLELVSGRQEEARPARRKAKSIEA